MSDTKRVKQVGTGFKTSKNRNTFDNFIDTAVSNIRPKDIADDIIGTLKKAAWDILTGILDNVLWPGGSNKKQKNGTHTSYSSYYGRRNESRTTSTASYEEHQNQRKQKPGCKYDDIIAPTRIDAEQICKELMDALEHYDTVTVGDLYDAAGVDCPYTYHTYGWTSLDELSIERVRGGFLISLPPAKPLT